MVDSARAFQFRPGIWSEFLHGLPPEEKVRAYAGKGWLELELSTEDGEVLLQRGDPCRVGREFRDFAGSLGVAYPQGHLWIEADVADPARSDTLDRLGAWIDLFAAVGVRNAVIHPGGHALEKQKTDPARVFDLNVRAFGTLACHAADSGVILCLENTGHAAAEPLLRLLDAVGHPNLGLCLDTGHLNIAKGDPSSYIRAAGPRLRALHIADNEGASDQHLMPCGRGTVPWPAVMGALREIGYCDLFNLEIPGESRCPIEVRLLKLDYLRPLMAWMARL